MKNHTELLLALPSMCQSRDLLIHVLYVCVQSTHSLRLLSSSLLFLKFWKLHFMYFGRKYAETGSNCSYKLDTFYKYHMP